MVIYVTVMVYDETALGGTPTFKQRDASATVTIPDSMVQYPKTIHSAGHTAKALVISTLGDVADELAHSKMAKKGLVQDVVHKE